MEQQLSVDAASSIFQGISQVPFKMHWGKKKIIAKVYISFKHLN